MTINEEEEEDTVDLLIVGAGPSGLMLAAWASQYDIRTVLIDKEEHRVTTGHADGLHSRTVEILHSFGLADQNPDPERPEHIRRTQRAQSQPVNLSDYPQLGLHQGAIEQVFLDYLAAKGRVRVERGLAPTTIDIDEDDVDDHDSYPLHVTLKSSKPGDTALPRRLRAKYLVGCDGAHSFVRKRLGIPMEGEQTEMHFGVMDVVPLTDFPDIRQSCVIHSRAGSVMTVPRENRLIRLYVQLGATPKGEPRPSRDTVKPEKILKHAREVMKPYSLDFRICDWHSMYTMQQRVASHFQYKNRIFLTGDAVHTHSPTMGQGMNVSMQDSFNLGWKLGAVLTHLSPPRILQTYESERRPIALDLIALDKRMGKFYSEGPSPESQEYQKFRDGFAEFLSGVSVTYSPSAVGAATKTPGKADPPATNILVGRRLPSHKLVCNAEAVVLRTASLFPSTGSFRILVFAGPITTSTPQFARIQHLGTTLETLLQHFSPSQTETSRSSSAIEIFLLHSGSRTDLNVLDLHPVFHPWDEERGYDYWKVYSDDAGTLEPGVGSAYEAYGVDREGGCVVVVRPDGHVAYVGPVEGGEEGLWEYFGGCLAAREWRN